MAAGIGRSLAMTKVMLLLHPASRLPTSAILPRDMGAISLWDRRTVKYRKVVRLASRDDVGLLAILSLPQAASIPRHALAARRRASSRCSPSGSRTATRVIASRRAIQSLHVNPD
jgi:hypothetical protein